MMETKSEQSPLRTVGRGFLFGAGVSGGILAIVVVSLFLSIRRSDPEIRTLENLPFHLNVSNTKPILTPYTISIIGSLTNDGTAESIPVQLEADLKNREGSFLFRCKDYYKRTLRPQESKPFQVDCMGITKEIYEDFDHANIEVVR